MITLNDVALDFGKYPNKETSFKLDSNLIGDYNVFDFKYEDDSSLIQLMFAKKEVDWLNPNANNILIIQYMPYSRLDRREEEVCFTLKYVAEFVNYLGFTEIVVAEPHSDVTCGALDRSIPAPITPAIFTKALEDSLIDFDDKVDYICFPDAGAQKKYSHLEIENSVVGMKHRDFKTGKILSYDIYVPQGNQDPKYGSVVERKTLEGRNVVILDDLCSRGGTFILMASQLRRLGAKSVTLVITHCEYTIFDGDIFKTDLIDKVITSNSIINKDSVDSILQMKLCVYDLKDIG